MKVTDIVQKLDLQVFSGHEGLGREITGGYSSDLLSNVMGNADAGTVWITIQTHRNVIAIAALKELAAVIIPSDEKPGDDTVSQSDEKAFRFSEPACPHLNLTENYTTFCQDHENLQG